MLRVLTYHFIPLSNPVNPECYTTLKFSALRTKKPHRVDNVWTQILDYHSLFKRFPIAKLVQMHETAK